MEERLQKLISASGLTSRRGAEDWITAGRVTVNGQVAALGDKADLARDQVLVDGRPLPRKQADRRTYLMLNKPRGYVSTLSDEKGRRTVAQLVSGCGCRVWPGGAAGHGLGGSAAAHRRRGADPSPHPPQPPGGGRNTWCG